MRNYTDNTRPQTVARYLGIRREGKSGMDWTVEALERVYANMTQDDSDFFRDEAGYSVRINPAKMAEEFDVLDPQTLEPTGDTSTVGELFNLVQSFYVAEAKKRDARENPEA